MATKGPKTVEITPDQIQQYNQSQAQKCSAAIEQALEAYNCSLIAKPHINDAGAIVASIAVVNR